MTSSDGIGKGESAAAEAVPSPLSPALDESRHAGSAERVDLPDIDRTPESLAARADRMSPAAKAVVDMDLERQPSAMAEFAANEDLWNPVSMTGRSVSIERHPAELEVTDESLKITRRVVVDRVSTWGFASCPTLKQDPRSEYFIRFVPGSIVARDEDDIDRIQAAVVAAASRVEALAAQWPDSGFWENEKAAFAKFTIQHGHVAWWFLTRQGGNELPGPMPAVVHEIMDHICATYKASETPLPARVDPSDTNGGWPSFVTHPLAKLLSAVPQDVSWEGMVAKAEEMAVSLGVPVESVLANGLASRSGQLRKAVPLRILRDGKWFEIGKWTNGQARNRVVFMASLAVNRHLRPFVKKLKEGRCGVPGLWHDAQKKTYWKHVATFTHRYESDISGFDTDVARELQQALASAFGRGHPDEPHMGAAYVNAESLPLITPNAGLDTSKADIVHTTGGTSSGLVATSEVGTWLALTGTLLAFHDQGFDFRAWPNAPDFAVLHQGDDAMVASARPLDPDAWAASYAKIGLTAPLLRGDVFLARHLLPDGRDCPVAGRVVQQTLSHEHEKDMASDTAFGMAMLGFLARTQGYELWPVELQECVWAAVKEANWIKGLIRPLKLYSLATLVDALATNDQLREIMARAVVSAEGSSWLSEQLKAVEYNQAAQALVLWLEKMGLKSPEAVSLDQVLELAIGKLELLPWDQKLAYAVNWFGSIVNGKGAADAAFADLLIQWEVPATPLAQSADDSDALRGVPREPNGTEEVLEDLLAGAQPGEAPV